MLQKIAKVYLDIILNSFGKFRNQVRIFEFQKNHEKTQYNNKPYFSNQRKYKIKVNEYRK